MLTSQPAVERVTVGSQGLEEVHYDCRLRNGLGLGCAKTSRISCVFTERSGKVTFGVTLPATLRV